MLKIDMAYRYAYKTCKRNRFVTVCFFNFRRFNRLCLVCGWWWGGQCSSVLPKSQRCHVLGPENDVNMTVGFICKLNRGRDSKNLPVGSATPSRVSLWKVGDPTGGDLWRDPTPQEIFQSWRLETSGGPTYIPTPSNGLRHGGFCRLKSRDGGDL